MPSFKRLVSWVHDIPADTPEQADQLARITAEAVNTALKALGHGTAWAAIVTDEDCDEGGLTDILDGLYLLDEDEGCVAHVPAEQTVVPERLIAWRDTAVKAATDSQPQRADAPLMLTVPASGVRRDDIISLSGDWCTVRSNYDSFEGVVSVRDMVVLTADGRMRTWIVASSENVAVLRASKAGA